MKMKITILEDSVIESERLKNGIRKYGQQYDWDIEIDEYESGEEYFSKNSEGTTIQASAFFLDIQMGQMNGIEVAKRLRESGYQGIIVEEDVETEYEMGTENIEAEYKIYIVDFTHFPNQPNILSQSKSSFYESRETTTEFNLKHI